jgi:hypothetical protein
MAGKVFNLEKYSKNRKKTTTCKTYHIEYQAYRNWHECVYSLPNSKYMRRICSGILSVTLILAVLTMHSCKKDVNNLSDLQTDAVNKVVVGTASSTSSSQILYAGQTINAGTVSYDDIDTDNNGVDDALKVTYTTTNGWELTGVHFFVGASISEMPVNKSGNPQIGLFPYKSGDITGATTYSIVVPFTTLNFSCPGPDDYFVAAHAAVRKPLSGGTFQTETGWGDGQRLVQRGNWAMYNVIYISCDQAPPPPPSSASETAFAFDGDQAGCFRNYDLFIDNPNRWGWTNGTYGNGTYTWNIYAGAGQCDITKGTKVGVLTMVYSGTTATVTYSLSGTNPQTGLPYSLKEVHLYVGTEEFPRDKQGDYTIAPGQYPKKASGLSGQTTSFTVTGLSGGNVYVIAHAVVDGFPTE